MPSVFQSLEQKVLGFIKSKFHLGSMSIEQVQDLCKLELSYLNNIIDTIGSLPKDSLNLMRNKYLNTEYPGDKYGTKRIILDLKEGLHGKAGLYERDAAFGSIVEAAKKLKKIIDEVNKGAKSLIEEGTITVEQSRVSDVIILGILREADLFVKYSSYLWELFMTVLDRDKPQVPYRSQYLADNFEAFSGILEHVCDKSANYSFLKEIDYLKRKNADLMLFAKGSSFLPFLNRSNYSASDELHVQHGIIGFNIFAWIASKWEDWKYAKNQEARKHREWLKQEEFRFRQLLNESDPNSQDAKRTKKYIEAYSAEIAKLDQQIAEYEGTQVEVRS